MQSWHSFQDFPILKCHSPNASYSVAIAVKGAAYSARQVHSLSWTLKRLASVARAGNRGFLLFIHSQIIEDNLVHFCGGNYICVQETRKWCEPIWMGCSSWPLWRAYLSRSLSDGMMVRKRFYGWMRLPTFNKAIPSAIFNLQLHSENILELLKIIRNIKCCCGKRVTQ